MLHPVASGPTGFEHLGPDPCPACGASPSHQHEVRRLLDGAFRRIDVACDVCGREQPIWL